MDARPRKRARTSSGASKAAAKRPYFGRQSKEEKFFDTTLSFNFDATGEVLATGQLVLIPQGVTESTRVGRKCVITEIYLKGSVANVPAGAATAASSSYMWLVWDKQCNGAAATFAGDGNSVFTSASVQNCLPNLANQDRFVILKKWVWSFNSTAGVTTAYNNTRREFEFKKRCRIPLEYSSTAGALTELRSNNLFLLAGAVGDDDLSVMAGICRVRFSDGS